VSDATNDGVFDLDGLLPRRSHSPALPDRGGPTRVVHAARVRRRRRAARVAGAGGASLAVAGLVLVRPPSDPHSLAPAAAPTATATGTPLPSAVPTGLVPLPTGLPSGGTSASPTGRTSRATRT
jgi:hypothetical protein